MSATAYTLDDMMRDVSAALSVGLHARDIYSVRAIEQKQANQIIVHDPRGYSWVVTVEILAQP